MKRLPPNVVLPPLYRRHPVASACVAALAFAAVLDHVLVSHPGDDYLRYHGQVFQVKAVVEGGDLEIVCPDRRSPVTRVRLWGVSVRDEGDEAPPSTPTAEVCAWLDRAVRDAEVKLQLAPDRSRDRQRRLLAYAYRTSDGVCLNELMLREGLAFADASVPHPLARRFREAAAQARRANGAARQPDG